MAKKDSKSKKAGTGEPEHGAAAEPIEASDQAGEGQLAEGPSGAEQSEDAVEQPPDAPARGRTGRGSRGGDAPFEFRATHRYARTGARKARLVVDTIRGVPVNRALDNLKHDKHRAARMVEKVVASAVANALQDSDVRANRLVISGAWVNEGPLLFGRLRFRPGPMGRAMPIRKRTCHIHVRVADRGRAGALE